MVFLKWSELKGQHITEICQLWNREIGETFPMRKELFVQNSVEDETVYQPGSWFVVNEAGHCIGFIVTKVCQSKETKALLGDKAGWIQGILVDSDYREKGIGKELLARGEQALLEFGVSKIVIGRDPQHYFPGVPHFYIHVEKWLLNRDYRYVNTVSDFVRDADSDIVALPQSEGIRLEQLKGEDINSFCHFMKENFPGRWEYEARHYFKNKGTGREFVVLKKDSTIIGFCRINDDHSPLIAQNVYWSPSFDGPQGGIGPLGVARNYRGLGLGRMLVQGAINVHVRRKAKYLIIDWTELNDFYKKFGFEILFQYKQYEKSLL